MSARIKRIKSIYLDWNIFQDIMQNRKSSRLIENINAAKIKNYSIPYSHAHISDLLRCSNPDYVKGDLSKLEVITGNLCIGPHKDGSGFCIDRIPPHLIYDTMKRDRVNKDETRKSLFKFQPYTIDRNKLSKDNILIPYLDQFKNTMCPDLMEKFIDNFLQECPTDHTMQKKFRDSLIEVIRINQPAIEEIKELELYKYLLSRSEEIEHNFISIFNSYLSIKGKSIDSISEEDRLRLSYTLLDFFPAFKEKIERKNNMNNIITDSLHIYIASKCTYLISGDTKMIEKAKLIYKCFDIDTKIYHVDYFINNIEF